MALKGEMPLTAEFVAERRKEMGDAHVTAMIRRASKGERGCFYSVELVKPGEYRTFGAPFDWDAKDRSLLAECMFFGLKFAAVIQPPERKSDGAN